MRSRIFLLTGALALLSLAGIAQRDERSTSDPLVHAGDTTRINALLKQIFIVRETDPARATKLCLEALTLSKQLNYQKGVGRANGSLGWIYFRRGDYVKALNYSLEALSISERIQDKVELGRSLNNLAGIYNEEHAFDLALQCLKRAYNEAIDSDDERTIGRSLNNTALLFLEAWSNLDSAESYAHRALILSEINKDDYNGAFSNRTLGDINMKRGDAIKALDNYERSLSLSDNVSNSLKTETWNRIARAQMILKNYGKAKEIIYKNIGVTSAFGFREELTVSYKLLSELYQKEGNVVAALNYLQLYTLLHDSIFNEQNAMKLATLQNQAELDHKQAEIELLLKDTELHKKEIRGKELQLYAFAGGLVAILLIAALLFYVNRKVSSANKLLEQQKLELGVKNQEVENKSSELEVQTNQLAMLNTTKDKLFSIIGHDFRSPLNSLRGILGLLENRDLSRDQFISMATVLRSNLDSVSTTLDNLLQWSLAQTQGIHVHPVRVNLNAMVEEHVALFHELARSKNIRLENRISTDLYAISDEGHLRLVLRNLINNAIKYSVSGGVVSISNNIEDPFIKIMVSDTGIGIEADKLRSFFLRERLPSKEGTNNERGMGIGLMLCQEFVENNGGNLSVASEPGKGSVFTFTLKAA